MDYSNVEKLQLSDSYKMVMKREKRSGEIGLAKVEIPLLAYFLFGLLPAMINLKAFNLINPSASF
jgi:hypothetical protein